MTTMEAIRNICDAKTAASRVPVLATVGEVSSATGKSQQETAMEMDLLANRGAIMTGRTINEKYAIPNNNGGTRMKEFINAIRKHIESMMAADPVFRAKVVAKKSDWEGCASWVVAEVKNKYAKSNQAVLTDEEVFGMAVHFFDEAGLTAPSKTDSCKVVVSRKDPLTEKEKQQLEAEAKVEARADYKRQRKEEEQRRLVKAADAKAKRDAAKAEAAMRAEEKRKAEAEARIRAAEAECCLFDFDEEEAQA